MIVLTLLAACTQRSEEEKLLGTMSATGSWAASLSYIGAQWLANRVPTRYVADSIEAAQKEAGKARKAIEKSKASAGLRNRLRANVQQLDESASALDRAIEKRDLGSVTREVERCARVHEELDAIREEYKPR